MSRKAVESALLVTVIAAAVVAIDQFAASIARQLTPGQAAGSIVGLDIMRVDHAASGLLSLGMASAIASLPLTFVLARNARATIGRLLVLGNALVIGGALSNGLSMLLFGVVSDFLVFRVPVIGLAIAVPADIVILLGYLVSCAALVGVIAFDGWGYAARARSAVIRAIRHGSNATRSRT